MADQPIGISFIPTAQNAANGPASLQVDGGGGRGSTDLAQAFKVLSLRLPTVTSPTAPVDPTLLNSTGATGLPNLPSGLSPYAAVFQALLKSSLGMQQLPPAPSGPALSADPSADLSGLFGGGGGATDVSAPARVDPGSNTNASVLSGLFGGGPSAGTGGIVPKVVFGQDGRPQPTAGAALGEFDNAPAAGYRNQDFLGGY